LDTTESDVSVTDHLQLGCPVCSICMSICMSICLSVCLSVCLLHCCVISVYFVCHSVQYCTSCIVLFYVSICLELLVVWAFGEVTQFVKIPLAISSGFLTFADFWLTHVNLENAVKTVVWMHMCVILPTVKVQKDYATLTSVASRAFTVAAPTVWNSLSVNT